MLCGSRARVGRLSDRYQFQFFKHVGGGKDAHSRGFAKFSPVPGATDPLKLPPNMDPDLGDSLHNVRIVVKQGARFTDLVVVGMQEQEWRERVAPDCSVAGGRGVRDGLRAFARRPFQPG